MMKLLATVCIFPKTPEKRDEGPIKRTLALGLSPDGNVGYYGAEDAGATKQRRCG
jgi:hypothetical protein